ncbi:anthranilate phosphoribosyltransferase [Sphingobium sufflavum]|uniref:anthranilate phosphoribosyltransferase n=1 Tax=Sphingobium sufflavum TaxID=1129547 RepID=UPI001F204B8B|nr:anthranilate phosphoribosyltransferase [Sphingobium sufflavum]MCE7797771.1 anthranilate phosphoribosyltransferase [Sphingobium sufflavum]
MSLLPDPSLPLDEASANAAFATLLDGTPSDAEIASFLVTLSDRGETAVEIAAAARAMRDRMIAIKGPDNAIDVCGTGGDGLHTLNVSTAVALVVAACEVPVAKHGNRAATSLAGGADTLEALGLDLDRASRTAEATLADLGICFLFAQTHHPALARIGSIRKSLGRRTIFNLLGPLANPANVTRQLVGIARVDYAPLYAEAMQRIGMTRAMIVSGEDGMDELSLSAANHVTDLADDRISTYSLTGADAGLPSYAPEAIRGGDADYNAAALRRLLLGETGAYRDAVLFNAGAALIVAGVATDFRSGVEEAAEAIDKGLANALLNCWIAYT